MPSRNTRKIYVENSYYHVYNRGVDKRLIFQDQQDYSVFLKYLKEYLSLPPDETKIINKGLALPKYKIKNYHDNVELLAYCLMPNHYHFLIKQNTKDAMKSFLHSLLTRYTHYFNTKTQRIGPLFQGRYKACIIDKDNYLLHLSRYIHLNPREINENLTDAFSSYSDYLKLRKTTWVNTAPILSFFDGSTIAELNKVKINSYKDFVENYRRESEEVLGNKVLE
jgi:putative transposase